MTTQPVTAELLRRCSKPLREFVEEAPLERIPILEFLASGADSVPAGARVLDVGAGSAPYRELFAHAEYRTVDREISVHGVDSEFDIVAPAEAVPLPEGSADVIVFTQVLEHLPEPLEALRELHRLLVPGGRLMLTAPLVWEEHERPYDFFRYTRAGLEHLLAKAGFAQIAIHGRGDCFSSIAQLVLSAKWSLPSEEIADAPPPREVATRLDELAEELLSFSPLDAKRALPLGFQATAVRSAALAGQAREPVAAPAATKPPTPILYIAPWVDLGGSDKGTIDWFRTIDRSRWAPSLITTQPSANRWLRTVEPYAEEIWALPDLMPGSEFPQFILGFIETRAVEVVHIMNSRLAFDLMPDISSMAEPPVLVVQHHAEEADRSGYVRYVASRYGNLVDAFSVTSRQLGEAMLDYDVARSRIEVIETGVDATGEFDPERVARMDGLGDGPRILWPGRFVEQKDPLLTLEILAELVSRDVEFTVDLVGEGDLEPAMRARAAELGISERLRWHRPSQEMPRWYRSADVLLMTSVFEGVPYVIYEALAMGVPVVAPALPGNVELLSAGGGALIDPRDDVTAYADALERLLTDADLRAETGAQARSRMLAECSLQEMMSRHEELYERLMGRRRLDRPDTDPPQATAARRPEPVRFPRTHSRERSVCVIVPCFQHGRFLPQAIESLKLQTLLPSRVIVVDDASNDPETTAVLDRLESDPLVQVIRLSENSGPSVARNRALAEVHESYVLPLDADDMLVNSALEEMVDKIERAPESVGFIYPNVQHFGNRNDYYSAPGYNLDALLDDNYCAAATLFDARVFEAGIRYAEDIVFGHEDWDIVLQMAEREIYGEPADGPCLMYRKRGFSRVNAVEYGPKSFQEMIAARHPLLYEDRDRIKARWAPALSLLLLDGFDGTSGEWPEDLDAMLARQSCKDFETLRSAGAPGEGAEAAAERLAATVREARGRFVLAAGPGALGGLARPTFVESAIRLLWSNPADRWALAHSGTDTGPRFAPLDDPERVAARPCAVAWERRVLEEAGSVEVGSAAAPIEDFLFGWQVDGPVQWRRV